MALISKKRIRGLKMLETMTPNEVAKKLGVNPGVVYYWQARAKRSLLQLVVPKGKPQLPAPVALERDDEDFVVVIVAARGAPQALLKAAAKLMESPG